MHPVAFHFTTAELATFIPLGTLLGAVVGGLATYFATKAAAQQAATSAQAVAAATAEAQRQQAREERLWDTRTALYPQVIAEVSTLVETIVDTHLNKRDGTAIAAKLDSMQDTGARVAIHAGTLVDQLWTRLHRHATESQHAVDLLTTPPKDDASYVIHDPDGTAHAAFSDAHQLTRAMRHEMQGHDPDDAFDAKDDDDDDDDDDD